MHHHANMYNSSWRMQQLGAAEFDQIRQHIWLLGFSTPTTTSSLVLPKEHRTGGSKNTWCSKHVRVASYPLFAALPTVHGLGTLVFTPSACLKSQVVSRSAPCARPHLTSDFSTVVVTRTLHQCNRRPAAELNRPAFDSRINFNRALHCCRVTYSEIFTRKSSRDFLKHQQASEKTEVQDENHNGTRIHLPRC